MKINNLKNAMRKGTRQHDLIVLNNGLTCAMSHKKRCNTSINMIERE